MCKPIPLGCSGRVGKWQAWKGAQRSQQRTLRDIDSTLTACKARGSDAVSVEPCRRSCYSEGNRARQIRLKHTKVLYADGVSKFSSKGLLKTFLCLPAHVAWAEDQFLFIKRLLRKALGCQIFVFDVGTGLTCGSASVAVRSTFANPNEALLGYLYRRLATTVSCPSNMTGLQVQYVRVMSTMGLQTGRSRSDPESRPRPNPPLYRT